MSAVAERTAKPTLHEIAEMPYPRSIEAMRRHYNPMWGRGKDGEMIPWKVKLEYSYRVEEAFFCEVEAVDEEEALTVARNKFDRECPVAGEIDCMIDDEEAKPA